VLGRQFSKRFLLGMGVAVVGAIAIAIQDLQVSSGLMGDVAALFAAILSAVNILIVEQLRVQFSAPSIML
ncbi:MAG: EamA family transporter, partial [Phormidesmis sp.]